MTAILYFLVVISMALVVAAPGPRALAGSQEYEVKTAFVYNFAKFVEWPASAFADAQAPLVIGALEQDVSREALNSLNGKTAQGRKINIRIAGNANELQKCQIVFISADSKKYLPQILSVLSGQSVLVITEGDKNFGADGSMINLITVDNKVRFEINNILARKAGLKISSQLLKLDYDVKQ